jgi:hypothetical protein
MDAKAADAESQWYTYFHRTKAYCSAWSCAFSWILRTATNGSPCTKTISTVPISGCLPARNYKDDTSPGSAEVGANAQTARYVSRPYSHTFHGYAIATGTTTALSALGTSLQYVV